ncbi:von Willebrand factor type A domain protein [Dictyocaulus viviparus]|uniref:von Willebrand factor type A domain protein n=1 Tax=Dictyocaulus viviparus TaxID=29172 RepID=A0A0D8XW29_DICVI|nr:von Willebrand factor type A domain protein [Dictyocaulus viviparus]
MRVSAARHPSANVGPSQSCQADQKYLKMRKSWNFIKMNMMEVEIPDDHWKQGDPNNMCSDRSMTTAAMVRDGYVDVPAIARFVVLCTFGNPPNLSTRKLDTMCSSEAHYDSGKGQCVCNVPDSDAKLKEPAKYAIYPPGTVCMSCTSSVTRRAVVFILDSTASVGGSGYTQEVNFVLNVLSSLTSTTVRAGVVVLACPSFIGLELDDYTGDSLKQWVQKQSYRYSATNTNEAYRLAETKLLNDISDEKILVILSDGERTNCVNGKLANVADETVSVANNLRSKGVKIIYIQVGHAYENEVLDTVNHNTNSIINVNDFMALDTNTLINVVNKICSAVE